MVKRKEVPKKGANAGFAARTAPPVRDSTSDSDAASTPEITENIPRVATARKSTAPAAKQLSKVAKIAKKKTKVLKEIRHLQSTTNLLIPRAPFLRLVIYFKF